MNNKQTTTTKLGQDTAPATLKSVCISLTLPVEIYNNMSKEARRRGLKNIQQLVISQNQLV
jgi:hypothetical protein